MVLGANRQLKQVTPFHSCTITSSLASLASMALYHLRWGEGSGKTPLHGFVLIARASDKLILMKLMGNAPKCPH